METVLSLTEPTWFALASVLLFVFGLAVLVYGGRRTEAQENHTLVHVLVCFIAGTAYAVMASGLGTAILGVGEAAHEIAFARYIDWSFTTPLLLFGIALTAMHERLSHAGLLILLIGLDVLMILTGPLAAALPKSAQVPILAWFVLGCLFYLGMLWIIWGPLLREARIRGPHVRRIYARHAGILTVLWTIYPLVFILGSGGLGYWSAVTSTAIVVVLDVTAKGIYGLIAVHGTHELIRDRGDARPAAQPRARQPDRRAA